MNKDQVEMAKTATSARDLSRIAHEAGLSLSDAQADSCYAALHSSEHELSESELSNVTGGCGEEDAVLAKKYPKVKSNHTCSDHSWSYWVYTGFATLPLIAGGRICANCHYGKGASEGASGGNVLFYFCEAHPK